MPPMISDLVPFTGRDLPSGPSSALHLRQVANKKRNWCRIENAAKKGDPAKVYIYDEIGYWGTTASDFVKALSEIDASEIELHLNSPGGSIFDGVAIYNALRTHSASVTVFVDSLAASAASFIAQAGDRIVMMRGSTMMIHDGSAVCYGNEKDMRDTADILDKLSNNIADIYANRTGENVEFWREVMRQEAWYNAQEAVDAGLADVVDDDESDAGNNWDLSVFNHQGRENAPSPAELRKLVFSNLSMNKEASVKPENTDPATPATDGDEEPAVEPAERQEEAPEERAAPVEQEEGPAAELTATQPLALAGAVSFSINGVSTNDPAKIQAYINALEGAASEQKLLNRKSFIEQLCADNKIMASQVSALEELVLDPEFSDKQYEKWCASWDAASRLGPLAKNVAAPSQSPGEITDGASSDESEVETALEIVRNNKRANMSNAMLEKTPSYQKLVAANALDRL